MSLNENKMSAKRGLKWFGFAVLQLVWLQEEKLDLKQQNLGLHGQLNWAHKQNTQENIVSLLQSLASSMPKRTMSKTNTS